MGSKVEGFVGRITVRDGRGKRGPWASDAFLIQDVEGNDVGWFSNGFRDDADVPPKVSEGDYIRFEYQEDGDYKNIVKGSARKVKDAPERKQSSAGRSRTASTTGGASGGSTQQNIHYQNSRTAAIEAVRLLVDTGAIVLPKSGRKSDPAEKYEVVMSAVDKLTVQFFNDLESFRLFDTVADAGAINTEADGPLPDSEESEEGQGEGFEDEPL